MFKPKVLKFVCALLLWAWIAFFKHWQNSKSIVQLLFHQSGMVLQYLLIRICRGIYGIDVLEVSFSHVVDHVTTGYMIHKIS